MILIAVFLLSLSAIAFEILLTRVFSIGQWNHLSFMVISIALFGFAASGTFLSILDARKKGWGKRLSATDAVTILVILYTITAIISFIVLNQIPLDYFKLPLQPVQTLYLLTAYLLLALPFFFTGLVVSLAYAFIPEKTGLVYFSSMAGSACGAIIPVFFLPLFGEGKLIILAALIPMVLVFFGKPKSISGSSGDLAQKNSFHKKRLFPRVISFGIFLVSAVLVSPYGIAVVNVNPSPYKALSQILQFPDTRIKKTANNLRGRIDSVESPYIRFAPGLSLKFTGTLPAQSSTYKDGDNPFVLTHMLEQQKERFSKFTLNFAGYLCVPRVEDILLIQSGGGSGIPCAIASGARKITVVEQNPHIARIVRQHYNLFVANQNPRAFLAQTNKRFDVIHVENWGTSLPGSSALTQEYLFTIQAFTEYLNHLADNGTLIISRKLLLPPADAIRMWAAAYESLTSLNIESPEQCIAMLRNWDTFTLTVSPGPLKDIPALKDFAHKMNFDVVYIPGMTQGLANRFNIFDEPFHFLEVNRLAEAYRTGTENLFFQNYLLDVAPQTDSRPFPGRFLKWFRLKDLYKTTGSRLYSLLLSGEVIVAVVFIEAFLVAFLLLILPLFAVPKQETRIPIRLILYFLAVGAGFMFVELFFIKAFTLLFGDPIISFTVVLAGILTFSSLGGLGSQRMGRRGMKYGLFALIAVLVMVYFSMDTLAHKILGLSEVSAYLAAFLLLLPAGILMGLPFPLGMQHLLDSPVQRAYAWSANGCVSVLTSILSAQIALSIGIPAIMVCAALAYLVALLSIGK